MFTKIFCQSHNDIREKISGSITIYQPNLRALTGMRTMMGWVRKSKSLSLPPVLLARPQEDSRQPLTSSRKSSFKEMPWKTQGWAVFLLLSLVNHSLSENRGPRSWQRPTGAVCVPGGAAKPPPELCPSSKEPSVCKVALPITVWPQSFKSTSLCCAQIFVLRLLSRVLMSPSEQRKLHGLSLPGTFAFHVFEE